MLPRPAYPRRVAGPDYGGTGFLTTYTYNPRSDLTNVSQGSVSRSFVYDFLSRLTQAANPETGAINYVYDANSSCSAQTSYPGELISKTDARSVRTCMQYDALHRLIGKTYSDGTPAVTYGYDETSKFGKSLADTVGRPSSESTGGTYPTGSVFSYDNLGHIVDNSQCTPQNCSGTPFSIAYSGYNALGEPGSVTDGAGHTFTYGYNSAGRLSSLTSSLNDANHPGTLLASLQYNAFGSLVSSTIGSFPLTDTRSYTARNWLSSMSVAGPSTHSTGTVTITGTEGNRVNTNGIAGHGSVTISGSEQSKQVQSSPGSRSTVLINVIGDEQSYCKRSVAGGDCTLYGYDTGTVTVTVNGCTTTVSYGQNSNEDTIATALAAGFSCSTVTASASGASVIFTSVAYSSSANYAYTASSQTSVSQILSLYGGPSFLVGNAGGASSGNMTGGANPTYNTVYDSGTATLSVNGHADTYSWGSGSTPSSIASGLASAINGDGSAAVSATASGAVVNLTARTTGTGTNYSLTSSTSYSTSNFTSSSFSLGNSGAALTGGTNATYVYDSGTVSITVNGTTSSASYGQNDTTSTVASSLATAVNTNSPSVTASASGNVVTLTSKTEGAYTNYALTSSNASSNGFSPASFSSSGSGSTMTGGTGSTIYSLGLSYEPNGDVQSDSDNINGNWAYTYDDFDRLNTAVSNSGLGCAEVYDRYGNRYQQNTYSGSCLTPQYSIPSGNNRIPQFTYDLAGNVINDTSYTYAYDAEERISSVSTTGGTVIASYVYDADGRRVRKISGSTVDSV